MKGSKGFLLLELAVVLLIMGSLLVFVLNSFNGCIAALNRVKAVRQAQLLAEKMLVNEAGEVPASWQVITMERIVQGICLKEVQVLDTQSGKILFNLFWVQ